LHFEVTNHVSVSEYQFQGMISR